MVGVTLSGFLPVTSHSDLYIFSSLNVKMDQDSFSPCTGNIAITILHQTSEESGTSADVVVRVRAIVVQIQTENASIATIVPIATTIWQRRNHI